MKHEITLKFEQVAKIKTWRAVCSCGLWDGRRYTSDIVASRQGMDHLNAVDEANKYDIAP